MDPSRRSPLRILAPAAIAVFALALIVLVSSGNGGSGGGSAADKAQKARDLGPTGATRPRGASTSTSSSRRSSGRLPQGVYVVQRDDTLSGIAQKTGVPIARLQDLNPGLDQFSLVAGQRIKLR